MDDELVVTLVRSRSLKRFYVPRKHDYFRESGEEYTLEIDAPGLEYMSLKEDHFDRYVVKNLSSLFTIDLDIKFVIEAGMFADPKDLSKRNDICNFLTGISSVRHMIISRQTVKAFDLYSKVGPIPKFNNLSRLQAVFPNSLLQFLPAFLESCPNLKNLILKVVYEKEMAEFELINVPQCLLSTLECVELKGFFDWEEEEIKIVKYFFENSAVLKKLILRLLDHPYSPEYINEEVNKLTKRSQRCRVVLHEEPWCSE